LSQIVISTKIFALHYFFFFIFISRNYVVTTFWNKIFLFHNFLRFSEKYEFLAVFVNVTFYQRISKIYFDFKNCKFSKKIKILGSVGRFRILYIIQPYFLIWISLSMSFWPAFCRSFSFEDQSAGLPFHQILRIQSSH